MTPEMDGPESTLVDRAANDGFEPNVPNAAIFTKVRKQFEAAIRKGGLAVVLVGEPILRSRSECPHSTRPVVHKGPISVRSLFTEVGQQHPRVTKGGSLTGKLEMHTKPFSNLDMP